MPTKPRTPPAELATRAQVLAACRATIAAGIFPSAAAIRARLAVDRSANAVLRHRAALVADGELVDPTRRGDWDSPDVGRRFRAVQATKSIDVEPYTVGTVRYHAPSTWRGGWDG